MIKTPSAIERPSSYRIFFERTLRFLKVGAFLHGMAAVGILLMLISIKISSEHFVEGMYFLGGLWALLALCFFTVPFFAEFDAHGRYQNYKQIKDALFEMGFDKRLIRPFIYSKCQRDAVVIAGQDLDCAQEVKAFFYEKDYRWYHILPDAFVKYPLVLFQGIFWKRILFTQRHELQNFYW